MSTEPPERWCTVHAQLGAHVAATAVCSDAGGLQWYACDGASCRARAVRVTSLEEWWAALETVRALENAAAAMAKWHLRELAKKGKN